MSAGEVSRHIILVKVNECGRYELRLAAYTAGQRLKPAVYSDHEYDNSDSHSGLVRRILP